MFTVKLGVPEMKNLWRTLELKVINASANTNEEELYNKLGKTMFFLSQNPRHNGLNSHEINELTARYGRKVFASYLENDTPSARRIFWVYGPNKNDKSNAYKKITLSAMT